MPNPSTSILDDCNRANGAIGSGWTVLSGGINISSNTAVPTTGSDTAVWNATTYGPHAEAFLDITTKPADGAGTFAVGLLRSGTVNGYGATMTPQGGGFDILRLERYDAGTPTVIATTTTIEVNSGDALAYQLEGVVHRLYLRQSGVWSLVLSALDSTYTGNTDYQLLATLAATNGAIDNFGGGNVSPSVVVRQFAADTANPLNSGGDMTVGLASAATAGNLIVVFALNDFTGREITALDDDGTTSYSRKLIANAGGFGVLEVWLGVAAGVGAGQNIVATMSGTSGITSSALAAIEVSGLSTNQAAATSNSAVNSGVTNHSSGAVTPGTTDNLICIISIGSNRTYTFDAAGWAYLFARGEAGASLRQFGLLIQSAATVQNNEITSTVSGNSEMAILALVTGTAGSPVPYIQQQLAALAS